MFNHIYVMLKIKKEGFQEKKMKKPWKNKSRSINICLSRDRGQGYHRVCSCATPISVLNHHASEACLFALIMFPIYIISRQTFLHPANLWMMTHNITVWRSQWFFFWMLRNASVWVDVFEYMVSFSAKLVDKQKCFLFFLIITISRRKILKFTFWCDNGYKLLYFAGYYFNNFQLERDKKHGHNFCCLC